MQIPIQSEFENLSRIFLKVCDWCDEIVSILNLFHVGQKNKLKTTNNNINMYTLYMSVCMCYTQWSTNISKCKIRNFWRVFIKKLYQFYFLTLKFYGEKCIFNWKVTILIIKNVYVSGWKCIAWILFIS